MRNPWWVTTTLAAAVLTLAACGGSAKNNPGASGATAGSPAMSSSSPASSSGAAATGASNVVKTAKISGATVLTNAKGLTLYWFGPDTSMKSKCNGSCAQYWPPVKGPVTESGVMGTFGTIKRADGSVQATYDGHPLYTYVSDTAPGQNKGNNLNASGGLWHEVTESGSTAPSSSSSSSPSGGGGYGY
jgi:predicted lipoprotein with Yx(FWY)xxD motif